MISMKIVTVEREEERATEQSIKYQFKLYHCKSQLVQLDKWSFAQASLDRSSFNAETALSQPSAVTM